MRSIESPLRLAKSPTELDAGNSLPQGDRLAASPLTPPIELASDPPLEWRQGQPEPASGEAIAQSIQLETAVEAEVKTAADLLQSGDSQRAADLLNPAGVTAPPAREVLASDAPGEWLEPLPEGLFAQAQQDEQATPERFGAVGQTYWYVQAGPAISYDRDDDGFAAFGLAGVGITDFFANGHSINLELNKLKIIQPGDDAVGLNLGLLLRWHFVREETWSLYVDGGAGFLVTSEDTPANGGSQFNFTPQVGGGATFRLQDQEQLMVGLRWHHISNAELYPPNPGRDSILLYVGYLWPR
ncbi:MAG: hypothetical protein Fur0046_00450 [Cyanobacteria bacterium J069]|nr:MAG: acyloxyacyl hydrolase [Cyanobacteria bacterium J069]